MARARAMGTVPGVLQTYIEEAVEQSGVAVEQVPDDVWRAAGLEPPN